MPFNCTEVTPECPVDRTIYGYYPNLGANIFFATFFALFMLVHVVLGFRLKSWTFMVALVVGCFGEFIGKSSTSLDETLCLRHA
jgi:hypothetical protein